jgi:vitamin B12 transporter
MRLTFTYCCYWAILLSNCVWAQVKIDSTHQLQQIEIYTFKNKQIITGQELKGSQLQRLNSQSVADAVRYFAGVQLKDYGGVGGLKTIDVRGMGSQHVGVYYDGIQLGNAQNGVTDLGKFSLDDLEAITLYNGQKSSVFQAAKHFASASSIYLQSKKPVFTNQKNTNVIVRYKTGSIQLVNPSVRIEQKLSKNIATTASAEYIQSNGEYKFRYFRKNLDNTMAYDTTAIRKDGQIKAKRYEVAAFGHYENNEWTVKGYAYESDRGIPVAIVRNQFGKKGQTLVDKNYFVQANFQQTIARFETKLNAKFAYDYTRYTDTVSVFKTQNEYIQKEAYASWATVYRIIPNLYINTAVDYQYNTLHANLVNFSYPQRNSSWIALAASYQIKKIQIQGSLLGTFVTEKVKKNTSAPDKNIWAPTLLANYKPNANFSINAFYKRIFRMPTFNDLYYTNIGYSNLKPEYTTQYNLGFAYSLPINQPHAFKNISIQADAYYNLVTDKIIAAPNGSMFRWMMLNLGKIEIKGADIKLKSDITFENTDIAVLVNYTYQQAQDVTSSKKTYYKHQIPYIPWHSGSVVVNANYNTWGVNYSFIYVGERYDANQDNIKYNHINPWFTHDLSVQKSFAFKHFNTTASIQVNNLLNQYYDVVLNYPMPGRQLKFILNINI